MKNQVARIGAWGRIPIQDSSFNAAQLRLTKSGSDPRYRPSRRRKHPSALRIPAVIGVRVQNCPAFGRPFGCCAAILESDPKDCYLPQPAIRMVSALRMVDVVPFWD